MHTLRFQTWCRTRPLFSRSVSFRGRQPGRTLDNRRSVQPSAVSAPRDETDRGDWHRAPWRAPGKRAVLVVATTVAIMAGAFVASPAPRREVVLGVTFSPRFARSLGLDPQALYAEMLDQLGIRQVRLPLYWDEVEPSPGVYDFSALDFYLIAAEQRGVEVILVVGHKQPRWPEWYAPEWAKQLPAVRMRERILLLVEAEVTYARRFGSIVMWQVENEPFRRFGEGDYDILTSELLVEELAQVRRLDHRPTLMTDSGELSTWIPALRLPADRFGTTVYRQFWLPTLGLWQHPIPVWSYPLKDRLARTLLQKDGETIIVELQAEAWFESADLRDIPPERQQREFPAGLLLGANLEYARRTQAPRAYLWGVEWWYWMQAQGYPEYVQAARQVFSLGSRDQFDEKRSRSSTGRPPAAMISR